MCGRYSLYADMEKIKEQFDVQIVSNVENYSPNFNIAPAQPLLDRTEQAVKNLEKTTKKGKKSSK